MNYYQIADELKNNPNDIINDIIIPKNNILVSKNYALKEFSGLKIINCYVIKVVSVDDDKIVIDIFENGTFHQKEITIINDRYYMNNNRVAIRNFRTEDTSENDIVSDISFWNTERDKNILRTTSNMICIPYENAKQLTGIENIFSDCEYEIRDNDILIKFNFKIKFKTMVKELNDIGIKYNYNFEI